MTPLVIFGVVIVYIVLGAVSHRVLVYFDGPQPAEDFELSLLLWPVLLFWGIIAGSAFVLKRIAGVR